jgi:DICT domain-containing protein
MLKGSILEKLTTRHFDLKKPLNLGVYYKNTLVALCHALEDFILETEGSPVVLAAFQRGKWYLQEAERYGELADKASEIIILAAPDSGFTTHVTSTRPNVSLVNLQEDDPVAEEWHLMILSSNYSAMVLCQELSDADYGTIGRPSQDLERKFYGFWTFESDLVQESIELAQEHITSLKPELATALAKQLATIKQTSQATQYDFTAVVAKVVDYLETSQQNLLIPSFSHYTFSESLDHNLSSNKMQAFLRMAQIIDQADALNPNAAIEVASYAEAMGQILDLPAWQIKRLRLAGLLHRLPPLKVTKSSLTTDSSLPQVSLLRIMPQLEAIAKIITHQSEYWDGSGTPDGIGYDKIPLESRILSIVADFQAQLLYHQQRSSSEPLNKALAYCQAKASSVYDPKLVQILELLVLGLQQGMNLQANQPKIASGMWLLEEEEQFP